MVVKHGYHLNSTLKGHLGKQSLRNYIIAASQYLDLGSAIVVCLFSGVWQLSGLKSRIMSRQSPWKRVLFGSRGYRHNHHV
jgi:hypothetical protein